MHEYVQNNIKTSLTLFLHHLISEMDANRLNTFLKEIMVLICFIRVKREGFEYLMNSNVWIQWLFKWYMKIDFSKFGSCFTKYIINDKNSLFNIYKLIIIRVIIRFLIVFNVKKVKNLNYFFFFLFSKGKKMILGYFFECKWVNESYIIIGYIKYYLFH